MKKLLLLNALLFSVLIFAQKDFKQGYYINNQGLKVEGYIKSASFKNCNDNSIPFFEFKKASNQSVQRIEKSDITEFGSGLELKFVKMKALLDDVSFFNKSNNDKDFTVEEKTVFLNVLLEGKATLYTYDSGQGVKFLWKKDDGSEVAQQFLYKQYYQASLNLASNNTFKDQLFKNLSCKNQTISDFSKVQYDKEELISVFEKYNKCNSSSSKVYEDSEEAKTRINFTALLGYNNGNFRVVDIQFPTIPENFGMISIGAEVELLLGSGKSGFYANVEYKKAKSTTEQTGTVSQIEAAGIRRVYKLDASFLDIVGGFRLYKKVSSSSAVFIGGGLGINLTSGVLPIYQSSASFPDLVLVDKENLGGSPFFTCQVGYKLNKHLGLDINYDSSKKIFGNKLGQGIAKVRELGINLRYTF